MPGTLHIFRLGEKHGRFDKTIPEYQASYAIPGNTYSAAYTEEELKEFLRNEVAVDETGLSRALSELHEQGRTTIADVELNEAELGGLGLEQQPSES
jgi:predicted HAD superfamily Cof-like phosphohydrolase